MHDTTWSFGTTPPNLLWNVVEVVSVTPLPGILRNATTPSCSSVNGVEFNATWLLKLCSLSKS